MLSRKLSRVTFFFGEEMPLCSTRIMYCALTCITKKMWSPLFPFSRDEAQVQWSVRYSLRPDKHFIREFHKSILQYVVENVLIKITHRSPRKFRVFFHFLKLLFSQFFFRFTIVINRYRALHVESVKYPLGGGGEYAGGWTSAWTSTCVVWAMAG